MKSQGSDKTAAVYLFGCIILFVMLLGGMTIGIYSVYTQESKREDSLEKDARSWLTDWMIPCANITGVLN